MPEQVKKSLILSIYFALAVSTLLVFWQVRNFDFVNYDDPSYVTENPHVLNGLTADSVRWAFTTIHTGYWHALTWLSLMLDCQLFGPGPAGFHLTNLFFHIANTLLLFLVLKQMTKAIWQSAFVAALFALHPMHVESVAWIAERKDVLSTFFWMLTLLTYVVYVSRPSAFRYIVTLAAFALGLMAKPMLVTLPFLLLLLDYWPLNRFGSKRSPFFLLIEKIPLFAMAAATSVATFIAQKQTGAMRISENIGFLFRLANALISYVQYIVKMIWPVRLAVFYPHRYENVPFLYVAISVILLLAVTIFVIRFAKNHRYLVTGWLWYLGTLIPVIGIIQAGSQAYADRYTYTPYIGLFIMLAWGLPQLLSKLPQRKIVLGVSMVIILTTLGICASLQVSYWKNSIILFSHANQVTQNNWLAHNNRGTAYNRIGRYQEALEDFSQAIRIKPDYDEALNNLGAAYGNLGRYQQAIEAFRQAIKIKPNYTDAHYNLGNAYSKLSRRQDAIEAYRQAVKLRPNYAEAHNNLAYSYLAIGDKNSAMAELNILKSLNSEMANKLLNQINK
jgi:tetratricopeptide (TPR) repeat protein